MRAQRSAKLPHLVRGSRYRKPRRDGAMAGVMTGLRLFMTPTFYCAF
jgi:hypothetical protein